MADRGSMVYYGTCDTAAGEQVKVVSVVNPVLKGERLLDLVIGDILVVKFDNGNTNTNPAIQLKITEPNQNISVSADTGLTAATEERYDWAAQGIVSFVYTYIGSNNGAAFSEEGVEITSEDDESGSAETSDTEIVANYAWKPIEIPLASDDVYGVTKLITNEENLTGNENQPVSYSVIQSLIGNSSSSLGLDYNSENGNLTLDTSGKRTVNIPIPFTKTSQLVNDGTGEGDRFWSSTTNNYVTTTNLGIGYLYTPNEEGASQQVMRSFVPYSTFKPSGYKATGDTVNVIRIGRDALKAYQNGLTDIEPDPYLRLYGNKIDLLMGADGVVGIGDCDISDGNNSYERDYMFEPDKATFNQDLIIKSTGNNNRKLISKYIEYNGTELEDRLTNFIIKHYKTPDLTYPAATTDKWPTIPEEADDNYKDFNGAITTKQHLCQELTGIPSGYVPISIAGYNLNQSAKGYSANRINLWECYIKSFEGKYYFMYSFANSSPKINKVNITYDILCVKENLVIRK